MDMAHLRPEARDLALLPATERLARMPANRWIGYTRASQAITLLERLLANEPGRIRPRNLLIVGPTNNGKTAIAERFLRDHPQRPSENGEHEIYPSAAGADAACANGEPAICRDPRRSWRSLGHCIPDGRTAKARRCICCAGSSAACW